MTAASPLRTSSWSSAMTMRAGFIVSGTPCLGQGVDHDAGADAGTGTGGLDGKRAADLSHALAHSRQPDTEDRTPAGVIARRNAASAILHFQINAIPAALQSQGDPGAGRMALRVGQRFLRYAKERQLLFGAQAGHRLRQVQPHIDSAAVAQTVREPAERTHQV